MVTVGNELSLSSSGCRWVRKHTCLTGGTDVCLCLSFDLLEDVHPIHRIQSNEKKDGDVVRKTVQQICIISLNAAQGKFLTNSNHKTRFISVLSAHLRSVRIRWSWHLLMLTTAVELSNCNSNVVVVGEDVDLLSCASGWSCREE